MLKNSLYLSNMKVGTCFFSRDHGPVEMKFINQNIALIISMGPR